MQGFLQVAQIILASDLDARSHRGNTHTQTRSALYFAVDRGKAELVKALLQAGAVISEVNSTTGDTMLHMAALQGSAEVVCMLLNAGLDPKARNKVGARPLPWPCALAAQLLRIRGRANRSGWDFRVSHA